MDQRKTGAFIAQLRRERGWTQEDLGTRIGVTNKTVSRWENGNYMPGIDLLTLMGREFEVSLNELVEGRRLEGDDFRAAADENLAAALERPLDRLWLWLKRNYVPVIAVLCLCLLLAEVGVNSFHYRQAHPADILVQGTFLSGPQESPDTVYLVFDREGRFFSYRQNQPLEQGSCFQAGETVLVTVEGVSRELLVKGTRLYGVGESRRLTAYERLSVTPVFINVNFPSEV